MQHIREALGDPDIPVVIGHISDSGQKESAKVWEFGDNIREAQARYADQDDNAAIVTSTDLYSYSDPWHYDSEGFIDLGKQFALKLDSLINK